MANDPGTTDLSHNLFLRDNELKLFGRWALFPHPQLKIDKLVEYMTYNARQRDIGHIVDYVLARTSNEQQERFKLIAEFYDIVLTYQFLEEFRKHLLEIQEVLEAEKEVALADFNAYDFKQYEREDRSA